MQVIPLLVTLLCIQQGRALRTLAAKKPVAAVLISGSLRGEPELCLGEFRRNVVDKNPGMDFDFFAYLSVEDGTNIQSARNKVLRSLPRGAHVVIEPESRKAASLHDAIPTIDRQTSNDGGKYVKVINTAKMLHGMSKVENLRTSDPQSNKEKSLLHYDLVVRMRPDLYVCTSLDLTPALREKAIYLPYEDSNEQLAFDQFAVGPPELMHSYATAFNTTFKNLVGTANAPISGTLYPEKFLWRHLNEVGAPMRRLHGFHASLVRPQQSGTSNFDDPFAKLRKDFPTIAAHMPSHDC